MLSCQASDAGPFVPTQAAYGMGATGLIYEPLIQFDIAAPPKYYPWLATGYTWSNGGKTITFAIRTGVKWNNGTPMTPADVSTATTMSGDGNVTPLSTTGCCDWPAGCRGYGHRFASSLRGEGLAAIGCWPRRYACWTSVRSGWAARSSARSGSRPASHAST